MEKFDIEERWPELFTQLDETQRHAVRQALAAAWHEGWKPNREDVENLTDYARVGDRHQRVPPPRSRRGTAGHPGQACLSATPMRYETWESYFCPETYNPATGQGTLRNLYGERDAKALARMEYVDTSARAYDLLHGKVHLPRTHDAAQVRAIHGYLFQDVYEWAGQYRGVNISKNVSTFADVHTGQVDHYLTDVHRLVTGTVALI